MIEICDNTIYIPVHNRSLGADSNVLSLQNLYAGYLIADWPYLVPQQQAHSSPSTCVCSHVCLCCACQSRYMSSHATASPSATVTYHCYTSGPVVFLQIVSGLFYLAAHMSLSPAARKASQSQHLLPVLIETSHTQAKHSGKSESFSKTVQDPQNPRVKHENTMSVT